MSKRLQVLLPDDEMDAIRKHAEWEKVSVGEWVRKEIRSALLQKPTRSVEEKLRAIREGAKLNLAPSPDIEQMNKEIISGYLEGFEP